jgi:hypothetical protein
MDTERHLADIFTKPINSSQFTDLQEEIGVCHPYDLVRGGVGALSCILYILLFYCIFFILT